MSIDWTNIRIPRDLHLRLVKLAEELDRSGSDWKRGQFQCNLPVEFDEHTPLWYVIQKAITMLEDHRRRSSYAYRKARKTKEQGMP